MPPLPPSPHDSRSRREDPLQSRPFLAEPEDPDNPVHRGPPRDPGSGFSRNLTALATIFLVVVVVAVQFMGRAGPGLTPVDDLPPPDLQMLLMGRMAMGVEAISTAAGSAGAESSSSNAKQLMSQLDSLAEEGPVREWVRVAMVSAELEDPDQARDRLIEADEALADLESNIYSAAPEYDDEGRNILDDEARGELDRIKSLQQDIVTLDAIYSAGSADAANLTSDQRDGLLERHGYFAEIALAFGLDASDPARERVLSAGMRTMVTLIGAFAIGAFALLAGFVLFVIVLVKAMSRRGIECRYSPPSFGGSVYLETLALFLAGFLGVSVLASVLNSATGLSLEYALVWLLLLVPFWPLLRGQRWANHKHALGWTRGRGVFREVVAGLIGYIALLPIFFFGVVCTLLLTVLIAMVEQFLGREPPGPMTHPIMEELVGGDLKTLLVLLSLAALWAPLVEEAVFRGAYFHHLRGRWRVGLSALGTGFVFAVIHPQGLGAIPALMSLGVSFALLREWRGSLIAPITAHALHNGFLVTMLWLALS